MKIAEASARTCLSIDTLRFYEKERLISPGRKSGQRHFTDSDIDVLDTIARLRRLGISIPEIRTLLEIDRAVGDMTSLTPENMAHIREVHTMISDHIERIERQFGELQNTLTSFRKMTSKLSALLESGGIDRDH